MVAGLPDQRAWAHLSLVPQGRFPDQLVVWHARVRSMCASKAQAKGPLPPVHRSFLPEQKPWSSSRLPGRQRTTARTRLQERDGLMKPARACGCGCSEPVPTSLSSQLRLYATQRCQRRASSRRFSKSGARSRWRQNHRSSVLGRVCRWCGQDDSQANWSDCLDECQKCDGQRRRPRCPRCEGPFYKRANPRTGRPAGCLVASELPPGVDCRNGRG